MQGLRYTELLQLSGCNKFLYRASCNKFAWKFASDLSVLVHEDVSKTISKFNRLHTLVNKNPSPLQHVKLSVTFRDNKRASVSSSIENLCQSLIPLCNQVTELCFYNCDVRKTNAVVLSGLLKQSVYLSFIHLYSCATKDEDIEIVALAIRECQSLTHLKIEYCYVTFTGSRALSRAIADNKKLEHLSLKDNQFGDDGIIVLSNAISLCPRLTTLDVSGNGLSPASSKILADALQSNEMLTSLRLYSNLLGCKGVQDIADFVIHSKSLTYLDVGYNAIASSGCAFLAKAIKHSTSLTNINLSCNNICVSLETNGRCHGIELLADVIANNRNVKDLNLCSNGLTDSIISVLALAIGESRSIPTNIIMDYNKISKNGVMNLIHAIKCNEKDTNMNNKSHQVNLYIRFNNIHHRKYKLLYQVANEINNLNLHL